MNDVLPLQIQAIADRFAHDWVDTIDVGPGWFDLLTRLDRRLAEISPGYVVEQCKTKSGMRRHYARPSDADYIDVGAFSDAIRDAEDESATLCDECGEPALQVTIRGRCAPHTGYRASVAQSLAEKHSRRQRPALLALNERPRDHVQEQLDEKLSPEQISARLVIDLELTLSSRR